MTRGAHLGGVWHEGHAEILGADFGTTAAARCDEDGWQVLVTLPLGSLPMSDDTEAWTINVARVRIPPEGPAELSTLSPLTGSKLYQPRKFSRASIAGLDTTNYRWTCRQAGAASIEPADDGFLLCQSLAITNGTGQVRQVSLDGRLSENNAASTSAVQAIPPRTTIDHALQVATPFEQYHLLYATITDAESEQVFCRRTLRLEAELFSWKPHRVLQGDGRGAFVSTRAQYQFIPLYGKMKVVPYGLAQMDNSEIIFLGRVGENHDAGVDQALTVTAFSGDGGTSWSDYQCLDFAGDSPMMLAYLGDGNLCFQTAWKEQRLRFFSHDYGRTWPESVAASTGRDGRTIDCEGNLLADRDADGRA